MITKLLKTKQFIPNQYVKTFMEIDFEQLYKEGKRLILTDLDNTLISYEEFTPTKEILDKFDYLEGLGFEIVILSNNHGQRIRTFIKDIKIKGYANARKPLLIGFNKAIKNASKEYPKDEIVFIGDQLMTDIFCANRARVYSILVNPLKQKTEKFYTKFNRKLENAKLNDIKSKYLQKYNELNLEKRH
ncbi:hypothetical protein CI105_05670 [Candidatus Izimaplasma bacterium ZiA1]|uniref:YqeG family HAD IIIA-type phosphatase n=1 Tax=Candidatus Izimoplasma sp. ZiA1 TaxID=2024899 RepID=UPI000BAA532D|nr:hypothetical protein CI105_05670 [Candidatus Izimaplasma bacterium ZiA1]